MIRTTGLVVAIAILSGCSSAAGQSVAGHYQIVSIASPGFPGWVRLNTDTGAMVWCASSTNGCKELPAPR